MSSSNQQALLEDIQTAIQLEVNNSSLLAQLQETNPEWSDLPAQSPEQESTRQDQMRSTQALDDSSDELDKSLEDMKEREEKYQEKQQEDKDLSSENNNDNDDYLSDDNENNNTPSPSPS